MTLTRNKKDLKCGPISRSCGRPASLTNSDRILKKIARQVTAKYELAITKVEKTEIIRDASCEWVGPKRWCSLDRKTRSRLHRRVADEIKANRKRINIIRVKKHKNEIRHDDGQCNLRLRKEHNLRTKKDSKKNTEVEGLLEWIKNSDNEEDLLRRRHTGYAGEIEPLRWNYGGSTSNDTLQLHENLCTIDLFPHTSEYLSYKLSNAGLLRQMMHFPEERKAKKRGKFAKEIESYAFFGAERKMKWLAYCINPQDKVSETVFIVPRDKYTFEQLLQLLGETGMDIVLRRMGMRNEKNFTVVSAYFYVVKECWEKYDHFDFDAGDGDVWNVMVPVLLSGDHTEHLLVFGVENTSAKYFFQLDEGLILGEDVLHATGVGKGIRLMLGLCLQYIPEGKLQLNPRNYEWLDSNAFPNPKKHESRLYLQQIRGTHYDTEDRSLCLHREKREREIFTYKNK